MTKTDEKSSKNELKREKKKIRKKL